MRTKCFAAGRTVRWTAAALMAAAAAASASAADADRLIGPTWLAETIQGGSVSGEVRPTVSFQSTDKLTGSGGCNRLFGAARIAGNGLVMSGIATTRKACPMPVMQQEQRFLGALAATRTFRFTGDRLGFYDAAGVELVRFARRR